jgi:MinD superfamily P-loop ATPase
MKIAVASGKGGTGKTTVAVSLASSLPGSLLFDCDVEEPNANLFLEYELGRVEEAVIPVPAVDEKQCTHCGTCADFCRYYALAVLPDQVMVFPTICHGCGGCTLVCPENAIHETGRRIGYIEKSEDGRFYRGILHTGEPMASPLIRKLKTYAGEDKTVILDSPPGTACPFITTLEDVDYCILVTEPSPFGLHDLKLAAGVVREMNIPAGVILNRDKPGYAGIEEYCETAGLPLLLRIPHDRRIAEAYSKGIPLVEAKPEWKDKFREVYVRIREAAE